MKILIVEDDPLVREMVCEAMAALDHQTVVAASGDAALTILNSEHIDILLTDVMIPGMNGIELARQASAIHPDLSVILTSGYSADMLAIPERCGFLAKPFTLDALARLLGSFA
jgi:CheY-like chemotaxis protein